jgi:signal transduction histidine kinase
MAGRQVTAPSHRISAKPRPTGPRRQQRALKSPQSLIGQDPELLSLVAHELRGPLTVMRACLEMLADGTAGALAGDQRVLVDRATRSASRLDDLVALLLQMERAEDKGAKVPTERVDLAVVAREVIDTYSPVAAAGRVKVKAGSIDRLPPVCAERLTVELTLGNLLTNAIKFSPEGTSITVSGYQDRQAAGFSVEDHGPGISAQDQPHIFERFFRGSDTAKLQKRGAGLGLYVSRKLLERQGGRVWFASGPGQGSKFTFALPLAPTM